MPVQGQYVQSNIPTQTKKKSKKVIAVCAAIAVVIGIAVCAFVLISSKINAKPKAVAEKFVDAFYRCDKEVIYDCFPDADYADAIINDYYGSDPLLGLMQILGSSTGLIKVQDIKVVSCKKLDKEDYYDLRKELKQDFNIRIDDAREVKVRFNVTNPSSILDKEQPPYNTYTIPVITVKIDSDWYVVKSDLFINSDKDQG